ncbi:MAG: hypothetical protein A2097_06220 [Desulfobacula sp. GWF2_41_7]|nr:MAG: hypothetical protein A2097_06220 [Desulfobacula sp. GWF2_41_7]
MSLKINTNPVSDFSTYRSQKTQKGLAESLERLSTGKKINKASDDAAGMVIANTLKSQSNGFIQAIKNANDAVSITQVADGALGQASDLVQDIRIKAIQAASAAQSPESLQAIQADITKNLESLKSIADTTAFNGQQLLSGTFTDKEFQVGVLPGETVDISLGSIDPAMIATGTTGTLADIDVTTPEGAAAAIEFSDSALDYIGQQRSEVGAVMNRLESSINNLSNSQISTLKSESEIQDLDFAEESAILNRIKLLSKAQSFAQNQANTTAKKVMDIFN